MPFVELFTDKDAGTLEAEQIEAMQGAFPNWKPRPGNPEFWEMKGKARIAAGLYEVASRLLSRAFQRFGEKLMRVPPILAAPATVQSTWEAIDENGPHKIPAGTEVSIVEAGETYGFRVVEEVIIPAGKLTTEIGEVLLEAVQGGTAYNGLSSDPTLSTSLAAVRPEGIVLDGVTSGGVDEEGEDEYTNRLATEMETLTQCAVVRRDWEILARKVPGVARATALDNYDPILDEWDQPLVVSVAVVDANGAPLSEGVKDLVKELLEARSLQNIVTHVIDPTFTKVGVKVKVTIRPGFEEAATLAAVEARIAEYLSPALWGLPRDSNADPGNLAGWENVLGVHINEIIPIVDRVAGVDRVLTVELAKGAGAFGKTDVELDGPAALTEPGTIEASAE